MCFPKGGYLYWINIIKRVSKFALEFRSAPLTQPSQNPVMQCARLTVVHATSVSHPQSTRGAMGYLSKFPNWMESKQHWNERHGKPTSWRRTPPTCPTPSLRTILGLTTEFLRPRFTDSCLSSPTEEVPQRVLSSPLWKLALVFKVE